MKQSLLILFTVLLLLLLKPAEARAQADSTLLSYALYIQNILQHHPLALSADLRLQEAAAEYLKARGQLDPVLSADWDEKDFDDKLYFRQYQAQMRIPTQLGISVVAGYENSEGQFLNPADQTDNFGLWNFGLEVDLLQGLVVNKRKTYIKQAEVFQDLAQNEQRLLQNQLIYDASVAYLMWQQAHYFRLILEENLEVADTYRANTVENYLNGEKTALDTLEANILYQDARGLIQSNEQLLIQTRQLLENFLWFDQSPIGLADSARPQDYQEALLPVPVEPEARLWIDHPSIRATQAKLERERLQQRLLREQFKPKLKVKYNPLLATADNSVAPSYSVNDFKWGFNFSMPLLFRSARGEVQKSQVKISDLGFELQNKQLELQNKIEGSWGKQLALQDQLDLMTQNVDNYQRLLDGENEKFIYGESSVFLLIKRQEKYLEGRLKLVQIHVKRQMEILNFLFHSNQLIAE